MDTASTIAKFEAKPPLWITRYNLIKELEEKSAWWISLLKQETSNLDDWMTQSPFWNVRMDYRDWYRCYDPPSDDYFTICPIIEKVRYDYMLALNQVRELCVKINMSENEISKQVYELRQMMWREAQKETLCCLYGKIPDDMVSEIISYY